MKALAVFPSSREVRLIDQPEPVIAGPAEVKLRILEAGICGSDRGECSWSACLSRSPEATVRQPGRSCVL